MSEQQGIEPAVMPWGMDRELLLPPHTVEIPLNSVWSPVGSLGPQEQKIQKCQFITEGRKGREALLHELYSTLNLTEYKPFIWFIAYLRSSFQTRLQNSLPFAACRINSHTTALQNFLIKLYAHLWFAFGIFFCSLKHCSFFKMY